MWYWPKLQLTEHERQYVGIYTEAESRAGKLKPGVLRRSYRMQLASQAQRDKNIPSIKLIDQIQISRRARIFAITFSGNTDAWRLNVRNTNGTQYTNPTPRTMQFPIVSSLVAGSYHNALALGGRSSPIKYNDLTSYTEGVGPNPGIGTPAGTQSMPWVIEPNWVCQPNETIIFQGEDVSPLWRVLGPVESVGYSAPVKFPVVLNIVIYAWEFPGMSLT